MQTRTTAQAVVSMLEVNGIDTIFCLPGVQNDAFFDALYDRTNAIKPIHARHEQACAYMALGYAMATGEPSAYVVVPGPGFLNTTAALSTAYAVNAPVLALTGQIQQAMIGRMGQGVIDGRHRLSVTMPAGYLFWGEADVVLAVGTRLSAQQQNWGLDDKLKIIRVDVDSEELDRQRRPEIGIVGDATATM